MALVLGTFAAETLVGGGTDDLILGLGGNDRLEGLGGNDSLDGGDGLDTMVGGAGNDLYVGNSATDIITELGGGGTDTILAFVNYTLAPNVEKLVLAGELAIDGTGTGNGDIIFGSTGANRLRGEGGDDRLVAGFGDDTVEGGEGNDTLIGGQGSDSLVGGAGNDLYVDTLFRTGTNSSGTLSLPGSITEEAEGGNDTLQVRLNTQRLTLQAPDGSAAMTRVGSATNPLVGSWAATDHDGAGGTFVITFLDNGTYMIAEDGNDPVTNPGGADGIERGAYTWDSNTGAFSAGTIFTDTNGQWGMSAGAPSVVRIDGDELKMFTGSETFTLSRVASDSNPLVGAWFATNSGEARSTMVVTFLDNGTVVLAEDGDSSKATGDPSGKDGMELGTYGWDSVTGALTIDIDTAEGGVNTNGQWGFSHSDGGFKATPGYLPVSPFAVVLQANMDNLDLRNTGAIRLDGTGNELANVMFGNEGVNLFMGGGGDDSINGYGGNDTLEGGDGGDTASGGAGNDLVGGDDGEGFGNDLLFGDAGSDTVAGDEGDDTLHGGSGNDYLEGDAPGSPSGDDLIFGDEGTDRLFGRGGNDTLDGGVGLDSMWGGTGNDVYVVSQGTDVVVEKSGEGVDTIQSIVDRTLISHQENLVLIGEEAVNGTGNSVDNVIDGNGNVNILDGKSGDDTITGAEGNDTLFGGSGDDSIDGGDGDDSMIGGDGDDHYSVIEDGDAVVEGIDGGIDTITTNRSIFMTDHANVENLIWINDGGGGTCIGNALDNVMSATSGAGSLTMNGGDGSDTVSFAGVDFSIFVDLAAENAQFIETLLNMENATGGSAGDTLTGDEVANILDGGGGADEMAGGYGGDTYIVDDENDVVIEVDDAEILLVLPGGTGEGAALTDLIDTVRASINYALTNLVENLELTASGLTATGNDMANRITGSAGSDMLDGGAGADTLLGGGGVDTLVWRTGEPTVGIYNGGAGNDILLLVGNGDDLNLKQVANSALVSIERVDMRGEESGANILTVTRGDVLAMSSTDKLTIFGDTGDQVNAAGFTRIANSGGLRQYQSGTAFLLVENDVAVNI